MPPLSETQPAMPTAAHAIAAPSASTASVPSMSSHSSFPTCSSDARRDPTPSTAVGSSALAVRSAPQSGTSAWGSTHLSMLDTLSSWHWTASQSSVAESRPSVSEHAASDTAAARAAAALSAAHCAAAARTAAASAAARAAWWSAAARDAAAAASRAAASTTALTLALASALEAAPGAAAVRARLTGSSDTPMPLLSPPVLWLSLW
eukprot:scaffold2933_cov31-Tisochrysis_lutea.AAC.6